jgi:ligand-binding SRPBCC domain-containing protein
VVIVERRSIVGAPVEQVWQRVVTPEGINHELRPWMTMIMPRGAKDLTVDTLPVGEPIGRCWMLLFGVLPFDYDHLTIAELAPGRGFDEQSTMLSMRSWRHQRTLEPDGSKTVVRDRLTFELRAPLRVLTPVIAAGIGALFTHRQRRLRNYFDG